MPRNVYSEIYIHIVWRTKDDVPMIRREFREELHAFLQQRSNGTSGVCCHAVGGTQDHVHLAVQVPPTLPVADWIGELKGASSHFVNHELARPKTLQWQTGYGVVSFGKKGLPFVIEYIRQQEKHHSGGRVHDRLERIASDEG